MAEEIIGSFILLSAWLSMGAATVALRNKWLGPPKNYLETERQIAHAFFGLIWPLYLPVFLMWAVGSGKAKLPNISLTVRKSAAQRVEEYSEAPTKVLAQIVAAKILAAPYGLKNTSEIWQSPDKKLKVEWGFQHGYLRRLYVNGKQINLPKDSINIVQEALKKAFKINEEKRDADKKAAEQLAALEAVESLLELAPTDGVAFQPEK